MDLVANYMHEKCVIRCEKRRKFPFNHGITFISLPPIYVFVGISFVNNSYKNIMFSFLTFVFRPQRKYFIVNSAIRYDTRRKWPKYICNNVSSISLVMERNSPFINWRMVNHWKAKKMGTKYRDLKFTQISLKPVYYRS